MWLPEKSMNSVRALTRFFSFRFFPHQCSTRPCHINPFPIPDPSISIRSDSTRLALQLHVCFPKVVYLVLRCMISLFLPWLLLFSRFLKIHSLVFEIIFYDTPHLLSFFPFLLNTFKIPNSRATVIFTYIHTYIHLVQGCNEKSI